MTGAAVDNVARLFGETNLGELAGPQQVVILKDTATVDQALKVGAGSVLSRCSTLWCWDRSTANILREVYFV
jgi:hypothetical protein